jgi:hypothetical protein
VEVRVNGIAVATVPAEGLHIEGAVGLRMSHTLALEVEGFQVVPAR